MQQLVGEKVGVVVAPDVGIWPVRADPGQVEQVIVNLAINARDAMPHGGTLTISTRNAPDEVFVELVVTDTGPGISAEVLPHIFDPFFATKEVGRGTGLGLATVHGIASQSGGRVEVDSAPGRGTTFRILLPRASEVPFEQPAVAVPPAAAGGKTVLVVDDEEVVRTLVTTVLRAAGYQVLAAAGPEEAARLAAAEPGRIHLLVTDVIMPGGGGRQVADELRAGRPGLGVLYMSGYTEDEALREGVEASRVRLLPKPFTGDQLLTRVREALEAADRPDDGPTCVHSQSGQ